jgi:hypothetical protein
MYTDENDNVRDCTTETVHHFQACTLASFRRATQMFETNPTPATFERLQTTALHYQRWKAARAEYVEDGNEYTPTGNYRINAIPGEPGTATPQKT